MKTELLRLVDGGQLEAARKLLEGLHDLHGITDAVYDELSGYLVGGHIVHRQWEDALMLAQTTRCSDDREDRVGYLTGQMGFRQD
jgi:hypothetical protein